jgi:hypothetical protein
MWELQFMGGNANGEDGNANDDEHVYGRNDVQDEIIEDDDGSMYGNGHDGRHGYEHDDDEDAGMRRNVHHDDEHDARYETCIDVRRTDKLQDYYQVNDGRADLCMPQVNTLVLQA